MADGSNAAPEQSGKPPLSTLGIVDSYIRNQTPYLQGSIVHADQKAAFLLALLGIVIGYLETRDPIINRAVSVAHWRGLETVAAAMSCVATVLLVVGVGCAGFVVWPRYDPKVSRESASFVGISGDFSTSGGYADDRLRVGDSEVLRRQLKSHHYRCGVCLKKWGLLKWAYGFSAAGIGFVVLYFLLLVVHGLNKPAEPGAAADRGRISAFRGS